MYKNNCNYKHNYKHNYVYNKFILKNFKIFKNFTFSFKFPFTFSFTIFTFSLILSFLFSSNLFAATCSNYKGQASINEVRIGKSRSSSLLNQIEIYNINNIPQSTWSKWQLVVYYRSGTTGTLIKKGGYYLSSGFTTDLTGKFIYNNNKNIYLRNRNTRNVDIALVDENGSFIDYLAINTKLQTVPSCITSTIVSTTSGSDTSGDIPRNVDGNGTFPANVINTSSHSIGRSNICVVGSDLVVSNSVDINTPIINTTNITYTVNVYNNSCSNTISNIALTDTNISSNNFSSLTSSITQGTKTQGTTSLDWSVGSLTPGASAVMTISGTPKNLGTLNTNAYITSPTTGLINTTDDKDMETITVLDKNYVEFDISSDSIIEGTGSNTDYSISLSSSIIPTKSVTINYTISGTANNSDYNIINGTAIIDPTNAENPSSTSIDLSIIGDSLPENNETITFTINSITTQDAGVALGANNTFTLTVIDDDKITINIPNISKAEGNNSTSIMNFPITLSNVLTSSLRIDYNTSNGTAFAGSDYQATSGYITIPAGSTTGNIPITIFGDTKYEDNETLYLNYSTTSTAVTNPFGFAIGTIINDDINFPNMRCYTDNFDRSSLGTDWIANHSSGTFDPLISNNGFLLTQAITKQSTIAMLNKYFPPAKNKYISIEFELSLGNSANPADGIALVLSNSDYTNVSGAFGGSMGYAQKIGSDCTQTYNGQANSCPGFNGGWLGIAFDEYGNYSCSNEGRSGGVSASGQCRVNSVAIRGSGDGLIGYKYLAGTNSNNLFNNARYRTTIDALDVNKTIVTVEVNKNDGNGFVSLINAFELNISNQAAIPDYFRLSFTGSTGGQVNTHQVDNLEVCSIIYDANASDLKLSLTADKYSANINEDITFTATLYNYGPSNNILPINVDISGTGWSNPVFVSGDGSIDSTNKLWNIPTLNKGSSANVKFTMKATQSGTLTATGNANYSADPDLSNNTINLQFNISSVSNLNAWEITLSRTNPLIYTKVNNIDYNISVGTNDGLDFNGTVCLQIKDNSGNVYSGINCTVLNGKYINMNILPIKAIKNAFINIKSKYSNQTGIAPSDFTGWNDNNSTDLFVIKPSNFSTNINNILAGDFNLSINTIDGGNNYNGNANLTTKNTNSSCPVSSNFIKSKTGTIEPISVSFNNDLSNIDLIALDVGVATLNIKDTTWTINDSNNNKCIINSNSNTPNYLGLVGCNIETNSTLNIFPYEINVSNIKISNNVNDNIAWSYRGGSNNNYIKTDLSLYALNSLKQITKNFTNNCFTANNLSLQLTANRDDSNFTVNDINVSIYNNITSNVINNEMAFSISSLNNNQFNIFSNNFINGESNISIHFTAPKLYNAIKDPLNLSISNIKLDSTDSNLSNTIFNNINSLSLIGSIVDGRINFFDAESICNIIKSYGYIEIYASNNKKLPGNLIWKESIDARNFWVNQLHKDNTNYGNVSIVNSKLPIYISNNTNNCNNGICTFGFSTTVIPTKETIYYNIPTWLWYNYYGNNLDLTKYNASYRPVSNINFYSANNNANWLGRGSASKSTIKTTPDGARKKKME